MHRGSTPENWPPAHTRSLFDSTLLKPDWARGREVSFRPDAKANPQWQQFFVAVKRDTNNECSLGLPCLSLLGYESRRQPDGMAEFSLTCFGVGDGWPCADRKHAAFLYRFGHATILIDCGE